MVMDAGSIIALVIELAWFGIWFGGVIASIIATINSFKKYNQMLRHETRLQIIRKGRQLTQSGEVQYLSPEDIEQIVYEVRKMRITSEVGFKKKRNSLTVLIFLTVGIIGALFCGLLYRQNGSMNSRSDQRIIDEECYKVLERMRELAESGEVNYFSIEDIECQAEQEQVVPSF